MEGVLDYCFIKLGVDGRSGRIDRPIVMTEPIANLPYARKSMFSFHLRDMFAHVFSALLTLR